MYISAGIFKIGFLITVDEAEIYIDAFKALYEKYEKEESRTQASKDFIINNIQILERQILSVKAKPIRGHTLTEV